MITQYPRGYVDPDDLIWEIVRKHGYYYATRLLAFKSATLWHTDVGRAMLLVIPTLQPTILFDCANDWYCVAVQRSFLFCRSSRSDEPLELQPGLAGPRTLNPDLFLSIWQDTPTQLAILNLRLEKARN
jgi:hypothetical protein